MLSTVRSHVGVQSAFAQRLARRGFYVAVALLNKSLQETTSLPRLVPFSG